MELPEKMSSILRESLRFSDEEIGLFVYRAGLSVTTTLSNELLKKIKKEAKKADVSFNTEGDVVLVAERIFADL